jgi:uncharacterized protein HemX
MSLEQELRRALKRKDPPRGFDDRVVSKIMAGGCLGQTAGVQTPARRWSRALLPIAASLMLAFGATYYIQQQQQQNAREAYAHAEQSTREVVLALRIASETVAAAQVKVEEITRYEPTNNY